MKTLKWYWNDHVTGKLKPGAAKWPDRDYGEKWQVSAYHNNADTATRLHSCQTVEST